jgi:hypothetical protein
MKRLLLAGILAGLAVFIVSAIDHMVLPIGHMGVRSLPNEEGITAAMRAGITQKGLYFFPGMDMTKKMTPEQEKAWIEKYKAGPTGVLVYNPGGEDPLMPRQLVVELLLDIVAACIAAWAVSLTSASFGRRALLVASFGVFAWLSVSLSNWNWYSFPMAYIAAEGIDQVVGWLAGGLVIAQMYRTRAA